jgi:uncharacterized membrane protein YkvI
MFSTPWECARIKYFRFGLQQLTSVIVGLIRETMINIRFNLDAKSVTIVNRNRKTNKSSLVVSLMRAIRMAEAGIHSMINSDYTVTAHVKARSTSEA